MDQRPISGIVLLVSRCSVWHQAVEEEAISVQQEAGRSSLRAVMVDTFGLYYVYCIHELPTMLFILDDTDVCAGLYRVIPAVDSVFRASWRHPHATNSNVSH